MGNTVSEQSNSNLPPVSNAAAAVLHFKQELAIGKHWYIALLEAVGLWSDEVEVIHGQQYRYLIEGEAFDMILLAERLCNTVNGMVPESERYALLFQNQPPLQLNPEEIKKIIGSSKYSQYLNYFYGITVEEALIQAVREEVRKERRANCLRHPHGEEDEVFNRVYGVSQTSLMKQFRKQKHYHQLSSSNLTEIKEFTYWCFKYRVRECEKAKVASDTQKGLKWLQKNGLEHPATRF